MNLKVSCIIPAYNEGKRIKKIISTVEKHPEINEVVVVNDGSADNTLAEINSIKSKKIKVVDSKINEGKTLSIFKGIKKSKNSIILLVDSDLLNLNAANITDLITPVKQGKCDISIASPLKNSYKIFYWIGIDIFSGQRCFRKDIFKDLYSMKKLEKYSLEVVQNEMIIRKNLRVNVVPWLNVSNTLKPEKHGLIKGKWEDLKMSWQIVKSVGIFKLALQSRKLLRSGK
ncbi:Undecaprenyl-phosphate 4-deoxy-4-formamido-L-arabinose transferase [uncultured archaeon]|nr:Undecaprenyl-phosphate 4-deoxy-4-formamido-L-arabinose transferase [uncultured archaeon]